MASLLERYAAQIAGVLSCFDRLIISGTIPGICYAAGMMTYLSSRQVRYFDYPNYFKPMGEEIKANAERLAAEHGLAIEYIRSSKAFRKEERVCNILAQRGTQPGLVHLFSVLETCAAFTPWHDKATGKTGLRYKDGKCVHYYFYFLDEQFGLCYLRVPTWAPFRVQFYCNGHHWLTQQMQRRGIAFTPCDNTFVSVADWSAAQALADEFAVKQLHALLDRAAHQFCPVLRHFETEYHWSIAQVEYATDIVFKDRDDLQPLYEGLTRTAIHAVKPAHVATFLGRKLHPLYAGEVGNDFHTRVEGTCIKHHMGPAAIKLYDKHGLVLRIETTINDVTFLQHYRTVEHRDGTCSTKWADMKKTIHSLPALAELLRAANRRYLDFLSDLDDSSGGVRQVQKLAAPVRRHDRTYRGFNLFDAQDLTALLALCDGQHAISGLTNRRLRRLLPDRTGPQISALLRRLRLHGLIKKIGKRYKYYFTKAGRLAVLTALKLRELLVIPTLAGLEPAESCAF